MIRDIQPVALKMRELLDAYSRFAAARNELISFLDAQGTNGRQNLDYAYSCALVGALTGGAVTTGPTGVRSNFGAPVLTPDGKTIMVYPMSEDIKMGWGASGWDGVDEVALVAWNDGSPVAVHFLPTLDFQRIVNALGVRLSGTPLVNAMMHWNMTLEPLLAELQGVHTVDLVMLAASMSRPNDRRNG